MSRQLLQFGAFELDSAAGELRKHGIRIKLQEQPLQILQQLLEHPGEVVTREELQKRIWPADTFVDFDHGLYSAVQRLRDALGDTAETPRYVETLPRRGYRFIAPVKNGNGVQAKVGTASAEAVVPIVPGRPAPRQSFRILALATTGAILVALLFALAFRSGSIRERLLGRAAVPPIRSLAVIPLQNLSNDPNQEYFADGMTDALITDLAQIGSLKVISRTSTMRYKKSDKTLPEIARELNVDGIVEGTVQRSGSRVRITAQLIHGLSDKHLWADSYERDVRDVLNLEQELARAIADEIQVRLSPIEKEMLTRPRPVNLQAMEAYVRGTTHLAKADKLTWISGALESSRQERETARNSFEQAITLDPHYAPAYVGLAKYWFEKIDPTEEEINKARRALGEAVQLDPAVAEAHLALAVVLYRHVWNWSEGEREFRRAIELNPSFAQARAEYADYLDAMGRLDEGMHEFLQVMQLDPGHEWLPNSYYRRRQYDRAIELYENDIRRGVFGAYAHWDLAHAYEAAGRHEQASREWEEMMRTFGHKGIADDMHRALNRGGYKSAYRAWAQGMERVEKTGFPVPKDTVAFAYGLAGDKDRAFAWLERAFAVRCTGLTDLNVDPIWDPLRDDPRFKDLVRRVGLPPFPNTTNN
jgi:TolB-like protein/DNA-binding winged helix-turn-helix (wHTH) protein/Tfp pilus assembly protein PilF